MRDFTIDAEPITPAVLRDTLRTPRAGGYVAFEGRVRDHHDGKSVHALEYEAYTPLAVREGQKILARARARFAIEDAAAVHRVGYLPVGETAVWVGVVAAHRREAFEACQYIIDTLKAHVPIWKKEHFRDGSAAWVACHACGAADARLKQPHAPARPARGHAHP